MFDRLVIFGVKTFQLLRKRTCKALVFEYLRKLSQPERHDRYIKQAARSTGVAIKGATEPGDSLVDAFCSMYDDSRLRFIEWDRYVSKDQEMQSEGNKITSFSVDQGSGKLKIENRSPDEKADTSSDILVLQALTRCSLAVDQANLVSYTKMQAWVDKLVKRRTDELSPGFSAPNLRQIMLPIKSFSLNWQIVQGQAFRAK